MYDQSTSQRDSANPGSARASRAADRALAIGICLRHHISKTVKVRCGRALQ
jgi:hypothetical protein